MWKGLINKVQSVSPSYSVDEWSNDFQYFNIEIDSIDFVSIGIQNRSSGNRSKREREWRTFE